jgi:hypothetical protein
VDIGDTRGCEWRKESHIAARAKPAFCIAVGGVAADQAFHCKAEVDCQVVISEKQLLAEAEREKKCTRRKDLTDKQKDSTNTTAKAEEQREAERKNQSGIHKNEAGNRRQ